MFYSQIILAKKGPLGKVWQAAHWGDKKLGRPAIFATDISSVVDTIEHPAAPMALRVSGHLLLGVVRIYSRQVKYLADDCQAAMVKVKMAYKTTTTTGGGADANADAAITTTTRSTKASNLNVSNFGEYYDGVLEFGGGGAAGGFSIPFDLNEETAPEDWIPATLDESTLNLEASNDTMTLNSVTGGRGDRSTLDNSTTTTTNKNNKDDENWGVFDPFDEDDEKKNRDEGKPQDESTVSSIENPRAANDQSSLTSDTQLRRASVLDQSNDVSVQGGEAAEDTDFPMNDDDDNANPFGDDDDGGANPFDDDEDSATKRKSLNLELSRDDSRDKDVAAGISFGEEDEEEEKEKEEQEDTGTTTSKKKRKASKKRAKRKKKRKIVLDKTVELSNDHIRNMLADTSDIVRDDIVHPATWVPGQRATENVELTDEQILFKHLSYEQLFARPALADDGQLAPELLALFKRNTARVVGKPFPYELRDDSNEDDQTSRGETTTVAGETLNTADNVEQARDAQQTDSPTTANNDDETEFPQEDEDQQFPDDDGGNPFDDQEEEEQVGMLDDEEGMDVESPGSQRSFESIFELDATNALGEDDEFGNDDDDRQDETTTTSKWHKNTLKTLRVLKERMANIDDSEQKIVSYSDLSKGVSRRTAAGAFFELLQLKTLNFIELDQAESFGDIKISPGVRFMEEPPTK